MSGSYIEASPRVMTTFSTFIFHEACIRKNISTGCFLRPDIKKFCLIFTTGPDRIWFCFIQVPDFFLRKFLEFGQRFDLILIYDVTERISSHNRVL